MSAQDDLCRYLESGDVEGARRLWRELRPDLPQPQTDAEALVVFHLTRAQIESVPLKCRMYSHYWLLDHGLPSTLPDNIRPVGERLYPRVSEGVVISVNFRSPILRPAKKLVEGEMCMTAEECYAEGRTEGKFVRDRILKTKEKTLRKLFGQYNLLTSTT